VNTQKKQLEITKLIETLEILCRRVAERFPDSGLSRLSQDLLLTARAIPERVEALQRPNLKIRLIRLASMSFLIAGLVSLAFMIRFGDDFFSITNFAQSFTALIELVVYVGAAMLFLTTLERRAKTRQTLAYINEMRNYAHIIDMHQLTKDPDTLNKDYRSTQASPRRIMTSFQMGRYFDYCSELLAVTSKLAAVYVQTVPEAEAMAAVDQIEDLTTGLSQKIWQKSMLLPRSISESH